MIKRHKRILRTQDSMLKEPDELESGMFRRQKNLMDLGIIPEPLIDEDVPSDLQKRKIENYASSAAMASRYADSGEGKIDNLKDYYIENIARDVKQIAATQVLSRGLLGRNFTLGTKQTSIARSEKLRGYFFLNPTSSVGLTTSVKALESTTLTADGDTRNSPIGVATFREAHFIVDLTDTNGGLTTFNLNLDAFDSLSGKWATAQQILSTAVVGTYYINVGTIGLATDIALSWTLAGGAPSVTTSINVILKDGLAGSSASGLANTVYIGPNGVTATNGYPLLEGQQQSFFLRENLELFAIALVPGISLRVFEL